MPPGKPKVGINARRGINIKSKQGISRIPLSKKALTEARLIRLRKELKQK